MSSARPLANTLLFITEGQSNGHVQVRCSGRSIHKVPADAWDPTLDRAIKTAHRTRKRLLLDVRDVSYANAESYAPLVQALVAAAELGVEVLIEYETSVPWQRRAIPAMQAISAYSSS